VARDSLTQRALAVIEGPLGVWVLVLFALLEATVFPGPTEAMLIALVLARRDRAARYGAAAVSASVVGGVIGYHLGGAVLDSVLRPVFASYGYLPQLDRVAELYRDNAFLALASSGYTPVPYMVYTAMAGAADLSLGGFVTGSLVGRALKYLPIALAAYLLGPRVRIVAARAGPWAALVVTAALVLWVVLV